MEAWPEDELSRRERLRAQREAAHAAPARIGLKLTAVVVIVIALLAWLVVSWFTSARSASAPLPEPPALVSGGPEAGTPEAGAGPESVASGNAPAGDPESVPGSGSGATHGDSQGPAGPNAAGPNVSAPNAAAPGTEGVGESVVHVSGAVKDPGVVELPPGSRVHEAIEAAGGMTKEADPGGLNLAAPVKDGTLIWVPTPEELESGAGPPGQAQNPVPGAGQEPGQSGPSAEGPAQLINLNTADAQTLDELPGIGPALSERIIAHRETNGPFGSLEELAAVSGIGPVILADVEGLVTW